MLAWILALAVGALIGYVASLIMRTDSQQGALANIVIGIVGAALGRWFFGDLLNIGSAASAGTFSFYGLLFGVAGAVVLIAILRMFGVMGRDVNANSLE